MKQGTTEKVKFKKLKRRLRLPEWQAIGLLESLWRCVAANCPEGDIGRLSNEDIAASIEYDDDPDELINHLIECGWIDTDSHFRLVVHDWSEHAPNYLRGNLKRHDKQFADVVAKQRAKQAALDSTKQATKQATKQPASDPTTKPSLVKPSQVKPSQANNHNPSSGDDDAFARFWAVVHLKVGKAESKRAFHRAVQRERADRSNAAAEELIIAAMTEFAASDQADPKDHSPIHPATWLNQGRYDDDRETWNHNRKQEFRF